jgi:hypothetical protein
MVDFGCARNIVNFQPEHLESWDYNIELDSQIQQLPMPPCAESAQTHQLLKFSTLKLLLCLKLHQQSDFWKVGFQNWQNQYEQSFTVLNEPIGVYGTMSIVFGILESSATHWYQDVAPNSAIFILHNRICSLFSWQVVHGFCSKKSPSVRPSTYAVIPRKQPILAYTILLYRFRWWWWWNCRFVRNLSNA